METIKSYIKKKFDAFLEFAPGVILLGFLLGALLASIPAGWPRYLVSSIVFVLLLLLYKDYKREQREKELSAKIQMEKMEDGYSS